jgi:regulator of sigma E protease
MISILNVLGAILILSFLVIIHEFGHYYAAKRNGIKVPEFGIGFPPKLFKFKRKGTEFSINLIPFGGYVRLHGEDSHDPAMMKDKYSFASKTPWQKVQVIVAGVFMNFMVFWVLMSFALWNGVSPIITNQAEFAESVKDGYYNLTPEITVEFSDDERLKQGDVITKINGTESFDLATAQQLVTGDLDLESLEVKSSGSFKEVLIEEGADPEIDFYPLSTVPVLEVKKIAESSIFAEVLEPNDFIVKVNGIALFDYQTLVEEVIGSQEIELTILRDANLLTVSVVNDPQFYFVSEVVADSVAMKAGIEAGDKIYAVDGLLMGLGQSIPEYISNKGIETVVFTIERDGEMQDFILNPNENGLIGVFLTAETRLSDLGIDYLQSTKLGSVIKVKDYKVGLVAAPFEALAQGYKISKATVAGFTGTIYGILTNFTVSEQVGGPIQVAKMGYEFVGRGGVELINFIALISLSLAVINLLPIPALDGGRLVFIIIEAFRGKPVNQKFEAIVHTVGFMLLIGLIIVISFFDIIRL